MIHPLENGDRPATAALGGAVLHPALDDDVDTFNVVGAKTIASNRAFVEEEEGPLEMGGKLLVGTRPGELSGKVSPERSVDRGDLVVLVDRDRLAALDEGPDLVGDQPGQRGTRTVRAADVILAQLLWFVALADLDPGEQVREIDHLLAADLPEQVRATDQVLGTLKAQPHRPETNLIDDVGEESGQSIDRLVILAGNILLGAAGDSLLDGREMGGDADVARARLALSTAGAANRGHGHGPKSDPVRSEEHQFDDVNARLDPAIGPDLDTAAQAGLAESAVGLRASDLDRHTDVAQGVFAGRPRAAIIAADGDDIGVSLGNPRGNRPNEGDGGNLDRDAGLRIGRLQLGDDLREILDRVDVVVVRRGEKIDAAWCVACLGDQLRHLEARKMASLSRLGPLPDLDLQKIGGIEQVDIDAKASRRDLLPPVLLVLAEHVGDLAPFAVHGDDLEPLRPFGIGAEGRLALGTERHGGDEDGSAMVPNPGVGRVPRDDRPLLQVEEVAQGDWIGRLDLTQLLDEVLVALFPAGHFAGRSPDVGLSTVLTQQSGGP